MAQKAVREDRTHCIALCLDRSEGRESLHYDKRTLVEEEAFAPLTRYSGWNRSGNHFFREVEANHVCEVENAGGRPAFPPGGILELVTRTLAGVVIGLGRQEIAALALSEDGGWEESESQSEPLPSC